MHPQQTAGRLKPARIHDAVGESVKRDAPHSTAHASDIQIRSIARN
ncbi:MAG: hypothetical protein KME26_33125 [Oscillatoria princeps RMCB-10]|nr:hypothetical protein [Oscillatoria princeps RMCB-10]